MSLWIHLAFYLPDVATELFWELMMKFCPNLFLVQSSEKDEPLKAANGLVYVLEQWLYPETTKLRAHLEFISFDISMIFK